MLASTHKAMGFDSEVETVLTHDGDDYTWFQPRVVSIPGEGTAGRPALLMTLSRHLGVSDFFSGLYVMRSDDLGGSWTEPTCPPELDWVRDGDVAVAVADVTPGWHAASATVLAVGAQVRYSTGGEQLEDRTRSHQTAYSAYDPRRGRWSAWQRVEMPEGGQFDFARSACAQWVGLADGTVLLPFYYGVSAGVPHSVSVVQCSFDGRSLRYLRHGNALHLDVVRGLCEPSLVHFMGRFYLTLRNDIKGYVSVGDDGLNFQPIRPWLFDDGAELGSYNTQQHWVTHEERLFLTYTRRGAGNDHIMRNRAPLFIAEVDTEALQVIRSSERVLVPERGATLGNFGACAVTEDQSWVVVAEAGMSDAARARGATGAVLLARVKWSAGIDAPSEVRPTSS